MSLLSAVRQAGWVAAAVGAATLTGVSPSVSISLAAQSHPQLAGTWKPDYERLDNECKAMSGTSKSAGLADGNIKPPKLIKRVDPLYPPAAWTAGITGAVCIDAIIDKSGQVRSARPLSGNLQLRQAALRAVQQWQYSQTLVDGVPVEVQLFVTSIFDTSDPSISITQTDRSVTFTRPIGLKRVKTTYRLDGTPSTVDAAGHKTLVTAAWQGDSLVISTSAQPSNGSPPEVVSWSIVDGALIQEIAPGSDGTPAERRFWRRAER